MITQSLINTGVILGITVVTSKGHLLYFIRAYLEKLLANEYVKSYETDKHRVELYTTLFRPLLLCPVCMNSFWGIILCATTAYVNYINIDFRYVIQSILSILISTFLCYVANEYIFNRQQNTE
jgi:hypothetical protein